MARTKTKPESSNSTANFAWVQHFIHHLAPQGMAGFVLAKLDGRPPAAIDAATGALFPEHFEHGEHDMLPIGWRLAAVQEVCALNACTLGKNDDLDTLEYVEISEVSRGNVANIATYSRGEEPSRARRRLRHGDTVLSTVRPEVIGAMQVALPNEPKILEAFHRTCAPLFEQAEANRTQSRTLATLRDTLLPKLLSGELSVAAASATMEATV